MKIEITQEMLEICEKFANDVIATNVDRYRLRKQSQVGLIKQQIVQGKIAEFGVWLMFDKMCSAPDVKIYEKRNKSYDADLQIYSMNLHVKSQSIQSVRNYGKSWVFQHEDPLFKKHDRDDFCVFCIVNGKEVEMVLIKRFCKLKFGDPKLPKFKGIKKMVYLDDNKGVTDT